MSEPGVFAAHWTPAERPLVEALRAEVAREGAAWFPVWLASLPRRAGRRSLDGGILRSGGVAIDVSSYRACDAAAATLLAGAPGTIDLSALFRDGDAEERRMILKALPCCGDDAVRVRLLTEAHRTNDQTIFEAGLLDSDLPATVLATETFQSVVLKAAFLDLPVARILGWTRRVDETLTRMLLEFQTEREAAGRAIWLDTLPVAARAPVSGVAERIDRDLRSPDAGRRAAAGIARDVIDRSRRDG